MAQKQVLARRVLTILRSFCSCSQKYKKVLDFLPKTLDNRRRFGYNNTRRQGHGSRQKEYADVAELADALDSGSSSLKRVWVQIPSSAPKSFKLRLEALFLCLWFWAYLLPQSKAERWFPFRYRWGDKAVYEDLLQIVRRISICLCFPPALNLVLNRVPIANIAR